MEQIIDNRPVQVGEDFICKLNQNNAFIAVNNHIVVLEETLNWDEILNSRSNAKNKPILRVNTLKYSKETDLIRIVLNEDKFALEIPFDAKWILEVNKAVRCGKLEEMLKYNLNVENLTEEYKVFLREVEELVIADDFKCEPPMPERCKMNM